MISFFWTPVSVDAKSEEHYRLREQRSLNLKEGIIVCFKHHDKVLKEILFGRGQRDPWHRLFPFSTGCSNTPDLPTCSDSDSMSTHPLPHLHSRKCRGLDQKAERAIYQDIVHCRASSNDLLFIQNWVNKYFCRNTILCSDFTNNYLIVHYQLFQTSDHWTSFLWKGQSLPVDGLGFKGGKRDMGGDTKIICPSLKLSR